MCHCSNATAHCVESLYFSTVELNVLLRLKQLFSFPIPTPVSSHQLKHHITAVSKHQNIREQYVIATQILKQQLI